MVPLMPPLETFCNFDKAEARTNFFQVTIVMPATSAVRTWQVTLALFMQSIRNGDVLICQVQQKTFHGLMIRVIATDHGTPLRDVRELAIKVRSFCLRLSAFLYYQLFVTSVGLYSPGSYDVHLGPKGRPVQRWRLDPLRSSRRERWRRKVGLRREGRSPSGSWQSWRAVRLDYEGTVAKTLQVSACFHHPSMTFSYTRHVFAGPWWKQRKRRTRSICKTSELSSILVPCNIWPTRLD